MKKHEQIIILEDDEISMFVTQGILAPLEEKYEISYFTKTDDALDFIKKLSPSPSQPISLFMNVGIPLKEEDFVASAKKALVNFSSRLFLLSSVLVSGEMKKQFDALGFLCCIEKPLNEQKFVQAITEGQLSVPKVP